jgi:hypothetical protein
MDGRPAADLVSELEKHRPQPRIEQAVEQMLAEATRILELPPEKQKTLRNRLLNNGKLKKLLR